MDEKQRIQNLKTLLAEQAGRPFDQLQRNKPCPCGSGGKFKHCCLPKTRPVIPPRHVPRQRPVPVVAGATVTAVAPPPVSPADGREVTAESMTRLGAEPAKVYAYRKTGLWIVPQNRALHAPEVLAAWDAAIQEFSHEHCDGDHSVSEVAPAGSPALAGQ
jgi:hypothetical protein